MQIFTVNINNPCPCEQMHCSLDKNSYSSM